MKISDKSLQELASPQIEGDILHLYHDQAGLPTIGVGHLLTRSELTSGKINLFGVPVAYATGLTQEQSMTLLRQDLIQAQAAVNNGVTVVLSQNQFDALVIFTFNIGTGAFLGSTLRKLLNLGEFDQVPPQLLRWIYVKGAVCADLKDRRQREIDIWNGVA